MPKRSKPLARGAWFTIVARGEKKAELLIYGDIGESFWGAESVTARELVGALSELDADEINARISSYGGSVADGIAIYNALARHRARIVVDIDSVAASIASLIAMAGDTVRMAGNAQLMIHAPHGGAYGNANDMRDMAEVLERHAQSMVSAYASKAGKPDSEILGLLSDGRDHWYSADEALAAGFADEITGAQQIAAHFDLSRFRDLPAAAAAFSAPPRATRLQETHMKFIALAKSLGIKLAAGATDAQARDAIAQHYSLPQDCSDDDIAARLVQANNGPQPPPAPAGANDAAVRAQALADEQSRRGAVRELFARFSDRPGVQALLDASLDNPSVTVEAARARLLDKLGEGAEPLAGGLPRVEGGETDQEKNVRAVSSALLARAGVRKDPETGQPIAHDGANPYRGMSLREIARASLIRAGHNVGGMDALQIAQAALGMSRIRGAQTTSDFPVFLENTLHKLVLMGFQAITPVYPRFCKLGDVSDFRAWNRIIPGLLGNLDEVNEAGEYKSKNLPDGEKSSIQAKRRGNIIRVTPETIINDDLGAISDTARGLGMAGPRTIDRAVFALLAQNAGLGPVLPKTGNTLFHASHGNTGSGVPSVAQLALMAQKMRQQKFPGDDQELMDIGPSIALGNTLVAGDIQVIVEAQYDPDTANKLQRPNKVRGLVGDVVGTERMPANLYYLFADPNIAPVLEVVFLDGQREVRVVQDEEFSTGGLAWRGELPFGAGAIDYRGAQYSTGV